MFIHYTRDLRFDDRPDYGFLKKLLKTIMDREKIEIDYNFDWVIRKQEAEKQKDENKDNKTSDLDMKNMKSKNDVEMNMNSANNDCKIFFIQCPRRSNFML